MRGAVAARSPRQQIPRQGMPRPGMPGRQPAREPAARTYARALPIVPVRARGLTIEGADGRRYLDCLSGAGTLALGHNHPVVLEAIRRVLDSGAPLHVPDLATPVQDAFTAELFHTLPPGLADHARVQFCGPAGSDAMRAAFKLVRAATGRTGILTYTDAHHEMTVGALRSSRPDAEPHLARLLSPYDHRCPFGVAGVHDAERAAHWTEALLNDPEPHPPLPAGWVVDPVRSEDGVFPAPDEWMRLMRRITAARSIPLIADEVETGVGRTGAFWAVDHSDVTPDVMVLSKAIGGSLPLSVVVYRDELDVQQPDAQADTFRGNQLAMAAGTATLAYVRENHLAERAATLGFRMLARLRDLATEFPHIGAVRGRGLMIGVELVDPEGDRKPGAPRGVDVPGTLVGPAPVPGPAHVRNGTPEPAPMPDLPHSSRPTAPELAAAVQRECLRRGLIVEVGGPRANVVRLLPPLTISDEQATAVLDRLSDAVAAVARSRTREGRTHHPQRRPRSHNDAAERAG
ncbi:aminotransferase class III-fold pyridoxal phosphate-dependent enzyme [Streptomyces sp. NBC_00289]|uniref:aminotransferase class III-fold pyridoxal phosphate-dependent enzyme n=1 Tax=Streptomyces sp. NBC_00289 TaxID=2975703 RepID=UPI00352DF023